MQRLPDYREIELTIHRQQIVDAVASILYNLNIVHDDEHITNIQFKELFGASDIELAPLKVCIKKNQEVVVIAH